MTTTTKNDGMLVGVALVCVAMMFGACDVQPEDRSNTIATAQGLGSALIAAKPELGSSHEEEAPNEDDVVQGEEEERPTKKPPVFRQRLCAETDGQMNNTCAAGGKVFCISALEVPLKEGDTCWVKSCHEGHLRACRGDVKNGACVPFADSCLDFAPPQ